MHKLDITYSNYQKKEKVSNNLIQANNLQNFYTYFKEDITNVRKYFLIFVEYTIIYEIQSPQNVKKRIICIKPNNFPNKL